MNIPATNYIELSDDTNGIMELISENEHRLHPVASAALLTIGLLGSINLIFMTVGYRALLEVVNIL